MENEGKETIGYGDAECKETCPTRRRTLVLCMLMALSTQSQIEAASQGDMSSAIEHEFKQNELALRLGCKAGRDRM